MKKLYLLLSLSLILTACGKTPEGASAPTEQSTEAPSEPYTPIGDENTFLLPDLPDIGKYAPAAAERWYDEYTPELIPRDDYGTLIPYAGEMTLYYDPEDGGLGQRHPRPELRYGLCTEDGVIVTDSVYDYIYEYSKGHYMLTSIDRSLSDPMLEPYRRVYLVSADGSAAEKLLDNRGQVNYIGNNVYCASVSGESTERYFRFEDGTLTELFPGEYDTILQSGDCFSGTKNADRFVLDRDLQPVSGAHHHVKGASSEYYIFSDDSTTKLYGIRHTGSGEIALPAEYNDIVYTGGQFIALRGNELTILGPSLEVKAEVSLPYGGTRMGMIDGYVFQIFGDEGTLTCTTDGTPIQCLDFNADHFSGYHTAVQSGGTDIYDEKMNRVAFIPDMSLMKDQGLEPLGEKLGITDENDQKYIYDPATGSMEKVDDFSDGLYTVKESAEDGKPIHNVYSAAGEFLFRNTDGYVTSRTEAGRLYHYVSGDRLVTCREDGGVVVSVPTDMYE